jgi:DNA polymerase elongation subunit (family B)
MSNISPETLMDDRCPNVNVDKILQKSMDFTPYKEYAICPNGTMYRKDVRGILPELMEKMYNDRVIFKKKMIEAKKNMKKLPN